MSDGRIVISGLTKQYKNLRAVDGLSFTVEPGRVTGFLGPNGAGKTTTLRMLYTLMTPDSGQVLVDGIDAAVDPLGVRRQLGVLPDARGLYKRLTARENIDYFARLHGLPEALLKSRRDALIEALEMGDIADRRTEGFSQGQRVKTAIARALVHDPRNVILDEPTNGLDEGGQDAQRGGLAGAVRAEEAEDLALGHLEVDAADGFDHVGLPSLAGAERLPQPRSFDHGHSRYGSLDAPTR